MSLMTGSEYLESIRDGRSIHLDGKVLAHALEDARLSKAAHSIAALYDAQFDPAKSDVLLYEDADGQRYPRAFKPTLSQEDIAQRSQALRMNMEPSMGLMGRAPDFLNVWLGAMAVAHTVFDNRPHGSFGRNVERYCEHVKTNNLSLTHVLVNPQPDRAKPVWEQAEQHDIALKIVRETEQGYYVCGSRMVGTLALYAHEVLVMPSSVKPNSASAAEYCFGFALPLNTKGLHLVSRSPLSLGDSEDHPISSRFDENDAVLIFDEVFVPWDRTFIYKDPELASNYGRLTYSGAHAVNQVLVRSLVKAECLVGIVQEIAAATNSDAIPEVQQSLADLYLIIETLGAILYRAERDLVSTPFGTVAPNHTVLAAGQIDFYEKYTKIIDTLRNVVAGSMVAAPSVKELNGPIGTHIARHAQVAKLEAQPWLRLLRVAIDLAMSGFGSRQQIYEKYYQGPPHMVRAAYFRGYNKKSYLRDQAFSVINNLGDN